MNIFDRIFNARYYEIRNFEQTGKIYEHLGIKKFKRILLYIAHSKQKQIPFKNYFIKDYSIDGLKEFDAMSRKSEKYHVILAFILFLYTIRIGVSIDSISDAIFLLFFMIINILFNIYPILLQRYNRIRIMNALDKLRRENLR